MKSKTTNSLKHKRAAQLPNASTLLLDAPVPVQLQLPEFQRVNLYLVGCGGTGSHLATGLGALISELRERGVGVNLSLIDPDRVEIKNVGRQLFTFSDVGKFKVAVIAARLTAAFNVVPGASPRYLDSLDFQSLDARALNLVIGAVDNSAARMLIAGAVKRADGALWWLDCGNDNHSGQIALGNCARPAQLKYSIALGMTQHVPAPSLVYPDLVKTFRAVKPKNQSCAELTSAGEQGLMINRLVAAWALSLLHDFLITRDVNYFSLSFNARTGGATPFHLDVPTLVGVTGLTADQLTLEQIP